MLHFNECMYEYNVNVVLYTKYEMIELMFQVDVMDSINRIFIIILIKPF